MSRVSVDIAETHQLIGTMLQSRKSVGALGLSDGGLSFARRLLFRQLDSGRHSSIAARGIRTTGTAQNSIPVQVDTLRLRSSLAMPNQSSDDHNLRKVDGVQPKRLATFCIWFAAVLGDISNNSPISSKDNP